MICQTEAVQLDHSADFDIDKVLYMSGTVGTPKAADGKLTVPLTVEAICASVDEQIRSVKLHGSVKFELEFGENERIGYITAKIASLKSNISASDICVTATVSLQVQLMQFRSLQIISSLTVNEPETTAQAPSVYMCIPNENDLWCVAKRYSSDTDMIIALNALDENDDISGRLLIVPRIK